MHFRAPRRSQILWAALVFVSGCGIDQNGLGFPRSDASADFGLLPSVDGSGRSDADPLDEAPADAPGQLGSGGAPATGGGRGGGNGTGGGGTPRGSGGTDAGTGGAAGGGGTTAATGGRIGSGGIVGTGGHAGTGGGAGTGGRAGTGGAIATGGVPGTGGRTGMGGGGGNGNGGRTGLGGISASGGNPAVGGGGQGGGAGTTCGPATCPRGCCDGNVCVTNQTRQACGTAGAACAPCGACLQCGDAGTCVLNRSSSWTVTCQSASIAMTKTGGATWDPPTTSSASGAPDPFCEFQINEIGQRDTDAINDTFTPMWNQNITPRNMILTANWLINQAGSWSILVGDNDSTNNDEVCQIFPTLNAANFTTGTLTYSNQRSCLNLTVQLTCNE